MVTVDSISVKLMRLMRASVSRTPVDSELSKPIVGEVRFGGHFSRAHAVTDGLNAGTLASMGTDDLSSGTAAECAHCNSASGRGIPVVKSQYDCYC